ncbi:hypothetical protein P4640_27750, partial [Priestia aryabhattai]|uniref:hypothetical protein n=1 Tax=Priestia aryabhattai TaxID=412384 RepID=UPI002E21BC69|nr:hypothetical protein [Priestia aryabhattai]
NKLIEKMIESSNPDEFNTEGTDPMLRTNQYRHEIVFPLIHRKSMFISIFSFVERELFLIASLYQKVNTSFVPLEKTEDTGIDKAKNFFKTNLKINISHIDHWQTLKAYQSIRNFFVHNPYGNIRSDHRSFNNFKKVKSIKLTRYKLDDEDLFYDINVTDQFCLDVINTAHTFFVNFYDLLEESNKNTR